MAVTPAMEEMLITTAPPRCVLLASKGCSARIVAKGPRTFVARIASIRASSTPFRSPCGTNRVTPAQFTSTSQTPYRSATSAASFASPALSVTGAASAACPDPGRVATSSLAFSAICCNQPRRAFLHSPVFRKWRLQFRQCLRSLRLPVACPARLRSLVLGVLNFAWHDPSVRLPSFQIDVPAGRPVLCGP